MLDCREPKRLVCWGAERVAGRGGGGMSKFEVRVDMVGGTDGGRDAFREAGAAVVARNSPPIVISVNSQRIPRAL